jgi:hypothetical protein
VIRAGVRTDSIVGPEAHISTKAFPGTSCQATIGVSLRDTAPVASDPSKDVPEGPHDRSQARSAWDGASQTSRPGGYGVIRAGVRTDSICSPEGGHAVPETACPIKRFRNRPLATKSEPRAKDQESERAAVAKSRPLGDRGLVAPLSPGVSGTAQTRAASTPGSP